MSSAMLPPTKALGIPELVERVLDYAAPQDLLLWQRVSKVWQAAIRSSPRIQERLFFRVREPCETVLQKGGVVANPFVKTFAFPCIEYRHCFIGNATNAFDGKKASHPTTSWRQMYLRNPAMTELKAFNMLTGERLMEVTGKVEKFRISCETGITIGQFADTLKERAARHKEIWEITESLPYIMIWI